MKKDVNLPKILMAPTLSAGDKSQIIQELQRNMGPQDKGDTVKNFLKTLADNNRLGILEGVCEKFGELMGAARGEMDLVITSAQVRCLGSHVGGIGLGGDCLRWLQKLDGKTMQRLETAVSKSEYSQGKKLKVVPKVCFRWKFFAQLQLTVY